MLFNFLPNLIIVILQPLDFLVLSYKFLNCLIILLDKKTHFLLTLGQSVLKLVGLCSKRLAFLDLISKLAAH